MAMGLKTNPNCDGDMTFTLYQEMAYKICPFSLNIKEFVMAQTIRLQKNFLYNKIFGKVFLM